MSCQLIKSQVDVCNMGYVAIAFCLHNIANTWTFWSPDPTWTMLRCICSTDTEPCLVASTTTAMGPYTWWFPGYARCGASLPPHTHTHTTNPHHQFATRRLLLWRWIQQWFLACSAGDFAAGNRSAGDWPWEHLSYRFEAKDGSSSPSILADEGNMG